jgi:peptidase E
MFSELQYVPHRTQSVSTVQTNQAADKKIRTSARKVPISFLFDFMETNTLKLW